MRYPMTDIFHLYQIFYEFFITNQTILTDFLNLFRLNLLTNSTILKVIQYKYCIHLFIY